MKKLLAFMIFCFAAHNAVYAHHELTAAEEQEAKMMALGITTAEVTSTLVIGKTMYDISSRLIKMMTGAKSFSKGAAFGAAIISAWGFSEAVRLFILKQTRDSGVADEIIARACEKSKKYWKTLVACTLVGGALGALVL